MYIRQKISRDSSVVLVRLRLLLPLGPHQLVVVVPQLVGNLLEIRQGQGKATVAKFC